MRAAANGRGVQLLRSVALRSPPFDRFQADFHAILSGDRAMLCWAGETLVLV